MIAAAGAVCACGGVCAFVYVQPRIDHPLARREALLAH